MSPKTVAQIESWWRKHNVVVVWSGDKVGLAMCASDFVSVNNRMHLLAVDSDPEKATRKFAKIHNLSFP